MKNKAITCPKCDSLAVAEEAHPIVLLSGNFTCATCGHEWVDYRSFVSEQNRKDIEEFHTRFLSGTSLNDTSPE